MKKLFTPSLVDSLTFLFSSTCQATNREALENDQVLTCPRKVLRVSQKHFAKKLLTPVGLYTDKN